VLLGLGATATMHAGAGVVRRTTGVEPLDYRLLARWIGHMGRGRFTHASIADADVVVEHRADGKRGLRALASGIDPSAGG
jgi:hypothetical protein